MFAYGKLYALLTDGGKQTSFNHVLFFQCQDPLKGSSTDFFHAVWDIVLRAGVENGCFNSATRFHTLGLNQGPLMCFASALFDHSVGYSLGVNHNETIRNWKVDVAHYLTRVLGTEKSTAAAAQSCDSLRIGIFYRSEGSALRKFVNADEVVRLARTFTERVFLFTVNSSTAFIDAVEAFNSFDILITPHGSHLTNGIFRNTQNGLPSIIELVATCVNDDFQRNLDGHFASYELSTGHRPIDPNVEKAISGCHRDRGCILSAGCTFGSVRRSAQVDLQIDISLLQKSLTRGVTQQCEALAL